MLASLLLLAATAIPITGQVLDASQPLAGARIELHPVPEGAPVKSTLSRSDGSFELIAPESGAFRVVVQAKDRLPMEHLVVPLVEEVSLPPMELMPSARITVQALGSDGRPLAGLPIRVARPMERETWMQAGWQPAERHGVTGPDGKVTLPRWMHEPLDVYVTDPRYQGRVASEVREDSVTVRPLRVQSPSGIKGKPGFVTGKVVDAQMGKPIAGALVWSGLPPDLPPVRTGEDGTLQLPLSKPGSSFGVAAAGYLLAEAQPGPPAKPVTVALKRAARIDGQVVDAEGAPVAGAYIQIQPGPSRDSSLSSLWYLTELSSGTDGSFSIRGLLPGGVYKVAAQRPGHGRAEVEIRTAPAGRPTPPARVVLGSGVTVTGRIVDERGNPLEGAEVEIVDAERPFPTGLFKAASDASGAFSIRGLSPGQYQLTARLQGFAPAAPSGVLIPEGETRLDAGELTLEAGAAIEGKVTDARGRPVEGAEVQVSPDQESTLLFIHQNVEAEPDARSGKDGHFQLSDLEPGRRYSIAVHHPDYPSETVPGVEAPTAEPIVVELQPARTLSGRVVGPDGEPVPEAEIMTVVQTGFGGFSSSTLGRTDAAGEFRGSGLKPGSLDLHVVARGYRETLWKGVQIPQDRDPEPVTITMEPGALLEGRAVDQEGNPVAKVRVHIQPKVRPEIWTSRRLFERPVTGADGVFRVEDLAPGEYAVSGLSPELGQSAPADVRLGPGTNRVDLVFERGVEVAGRVVDEEGQPIPSASVQLESSSEGRDVRSVGGFSQADGSFRIPSVRDGEYQLAAKAKGYGMSEPRRLRVAGSRVEGIEVRLSREATGWISGRILGLSAEALSQLRIDASLDDGEGWENAVGRPDEQGRFRLLDLRAGPWDVNAHQPNGLTLSRETVVEPGAEAVVEFQFPEGPTFTGRISVDSRPLRGADIVATSLESQASFARARTDFEGKFSLGPLKPGLHSLLIHGTETALMTYQTVRFQEGQEVRLDIRTGGFQGRILAPGGEPVPDAAIQLNVVEPASGLPFTGSGPAVRSDAEGAFALRSIPSGTYTVIIQKPGFEELQAQVEIGPGTPRVQDIVIKPREM